MNLIINKMSLDISQGADSAKSSVDQNCKNRSRQASSCPTMRLDDLSNDFSSTFMLDEELELEQKTASNGQPSTLDR